MNKEERKKTLQHQWDICNDLLKIIPEDMKDFKPKTWGEYNEYINLKYARSKGLGQICNFMNGYLKIDKNMSWDVVKEFLTKWKAQSYLEITK
jgi:hypothetical protein